MDMPLDSSLRTSTPERQLALAHTCPRVDELPAAAPIVKWAGGKGRLLPQLLPLLPRRVGGMRHVEPFMGGASLFFACRPSRAILGDINATLVAAHAMVRDRPDAVIRALRPLARAHTDGTDAYYRARDRFNAMRDRRIGPTQAARFLYLNRTGFNGLYRVNRRGEFNVPRGRYRNPRIVRTPELRAASARLRGVELVAGSFEVTLQRAQPATSSTSTRHTTRFRGRRTSPPTPPAASARTTSGGSGSRSTS